MEIVDQNRKTNLDILRGLAITGVVTVHCNQLLNEYYPGKFGFFNYGKYGVEVFFFLSGFLIASLYGNSEDKLGINYCRKRFARIFPLWMLFLMVNLFLQIGQAKFGSNSIFSPSNHTSSLLLKCLVLGTTFTLFLSPILWNTIIPGGWSIQAEVGHYLLFPLIRKFGISIFAIVLIVCNLFSAKIGSSINYDNSDYRYASSSFIVGAWMRLGIYNTVSFFFLGIIFVLITKGFNRKRFMEESSNQKWIQFSVFVIFIFTFLISPCPYGNSLSAVIYVVLNLIVMQIFLLIRYLDKFMANLGKYSYFIYFFHFVVLKCIAVILDSFGFFYNPFFLFFIIFSSTVSLSLLFAIPSMKYIERPIILKLR